MGNLKKVWREIDAGLQDLIQIAIKKAQQRASLSLLGYFFDEVNFDGHCTKKNIWENFFQAKVSG